MNKFLKTLRYYLVEKESKWNYLFVIIPFIVLTIYLYHKHYPVRYGNYTIGYIDRIYWPIISYKRVSYEYTVNGKKYSGGDIHDEDANPKKGRYYLIQFSLEDPKESDIFQDIPVPDSIKQAPPGGWKERPEWAKPK